MRVQKSRAGGVYVLFPWELRSTRYRLIVSLGAFEVVVPRG